MGILIKKLEVSSTNKKKRKSRGLQSNLTMKLTRSTAALSLCFLLVLTLANVAMSVEANSQNFLREESQAADAQVAGANQGERGSICCSHCEFDDFDCEAFCNWSC